MHVPQPDGFSSIKDGWLQRPENRGELKILERSWDEKSKSIRIVLVWISGPAAGKIYILQSGGDIALAMWGVSWDKKHQLVKADDMPARIYRPQQPVLLAATAVFSIGVAALSSWATGYASELAKRTFLERHGHPKPEIAALRSTDPLVPRQPVVCDPINASCHD